MTQLKDGEHYPSQETLLRVRTVSSTSHYSGTPPVLVSDVFLRSHRPRVTRSFFTPETKSTSPGYLGLVFGLFSSLGYIPNFPTCTGFVFVGRGEYPQGVPEGFPERRVIPSCESRKNLPSSISGSLSWPFREFTVYQIIGAYNRLKINRFITNLYKSTFLPAFIPPFFPFLLFYFPFSFF